MAQYVPGNLVSARGRTWVVQSDSTDELLRLCPIGASYDDVTIVSPLLEPDVAPALFSYPQPERVGAFRSGRLLYDALRFQLRSGTGPFRSFGSLNFEPRSYQYVPLLMALRQEKVRLLIADDVGVGKTIEAGMIARELLDRGTIERFAVLCPPHLVEQWVEELKVHFNIEALAVTASTASRVEKNIPLGHLLTETNPYLVISLDYIKSERHRHYFQTLKLDLLIVDEAHACVNGDSNASQQRYKFLKQIFDDEREGLDRQRHLLLLTATPHSGNEDAFYNLLALLKPEFAQLREATSANDPLRRELAKYFVQRRRQDIERWCRDNNDNHTFFTKRMSAELTYKLTPQWQDFMDAVQEYCIHVLDTQAENKLVWYAIIALFRCISSSPQAALQALTNRKARLALTGSESVAVSSDAAAQALGLEEDDEGLVEQIDSELGNEDLLVETDLAPSLLLTESEQLDALVEQVKGLRGIDNDPKLEKLVSHVKGLLKDGFAPVIFCRFIGTADYVAEELKKQLAKGQFKDVAVDCVTGTLTGAERKAKVLDLGQEARRVLVATDCLSEGINLQHFFTAVVHYDMAWNPTRHEQREGRVDRFGQTAPEVRCTLLYSPDNPVDGMVLRVILRKSEKIRKELGVLVPVPDKKETINRALMKAALFSKRNHHMTDERSYQGELAIYYDDADPDNADERALDIAWQNATEKVKGSPTLFAQGSIHVADVLPFWQAENSSLGSLDELQYFAEEACAYFGVKVQEAEVGSLSKERAAATREQAITQAAQVATAQAVIEGTKAENIDAQAQAARLQRVGHRAYALMRIDVNDFNREELRANLKAEGWPKDNIVDFNLLNRVSPLINVLSEGLVEEATGSEQSMIARAGLASSTEVDAITRIYLLRLRYQMRIAYRNQTRRHLMVEEVVPWTLAGAQGESELDLEKGQYLLVNAPIGGNFAAAMAQTKIQEALELFNRKSEVLKAFAEERAAQISASHRGEVIKPGEGEEATKRRSRSVNVYNNDGSVVEVKVCEPIDLMGVYVLMPDLDDL